MKLASPQVLPNLKSGKEAEEIADLVTRLGRPPSIVAFDPATLFFKVAHIEGFIGYRLQGELAIVFSDPVCSDEKMPELTRAFHTFAESNQWEVIYVLASEKFARWAIQNTCKALVQVGEELIVDPHFDPSKGRKGEKLRWKVHHAKLHHVHVHEYLSFDEDLERKIKEAALSWQNERKGPQIYFADIELFTSRSGKRWFYAYKNNQIVGLLTLNRIDKYDGWVVNNLLPMPQAPPGTSELLVITAFERLREEGCHFFALGGAPGENIGEIIGFNRFTAFVARRVFRFVNWYFKLPLRKIYLKKFHPNAVPSYFLFTTSRLGYKTIKGLMKSLNVSM